MRSIRSSRHSRSVRNPAGALASAIESLELRYMLAGGVDRLVNNNTGTTGTANFTQSETTVIAYGNTVIAGFNDSGSNASGNKFTGFARSTDGGVTFTDGGTLPTTAAGDAGDPVLARNATTGRIYLATLGFSVSTIQIWRSDDNALTWQGPVVGTPGGSSEDKEWMTVDNFAGAGNGNVYLMSRRFSGTPGIYLHRSTDNGLTFSAGLTIVNTGNMQGAYVAVGPDHSVYCFWLTGTGTTQSIQMRKSTDLGVTFGAAVTVASNLAGGTNGDLGLTGIRQGTATASGFRSNEFPHVAVNPVSGHLYAVFANDGAGADKADIFMVQSTDGGATWGAPVKINDDATTTDQWQPTIAVTPNGQRLGVFYYSRQQDTTTNNLFRYWSRIATISGATVTFGPSEAVSDVASLPEFGRDSVVNSVYMGDYDMAWATNEAFHVIWADNRDDLVGGAPRKDPNVYYDKIQLALSVTATNPAVGSAVATQPTSYVVNFSEAINNASVQASDFSVNGIPATSFVINNPTQVTFSYGVSPVSAQGLQTMSIPANAITRVLDGGGILAFSGQFRYDVTPLSVTSTVPPVNGVFTLPGPFTYDVNFNEVVNPASVTTGDLALSGIAGASVTAVTVLPGNTTARFTLSGITLEGTLTATIAAGNVTDAFGNPNQTSFSGNYNVDIGTAPYPTPLLSVPPLGSLIYDPSAAGVIGPVGDLDVFTLSIDPRQSITVLVTANDPALQPSIQVRDPSNAFVGTATAAAAGQNALLQTISTTTGGTYSFRVTGAAGTTGAYTIRVTLNAAIESEGQPGAGNNNTLANAQSLNDAFITMPTSLTSGRRAAVQGISDPVAYAASPVAFAFEDISATGTIVAGLTNVDDTAVSVNFGFNFPFYGTNFASVFVSSNGLLSLGLTNTSFTNTDLTSSPTQATIAPFWDDLHTGGGLAGSNVFTQLIGAGSNQHLTIQWNQIRFFTGGTAGDTITFQAQLFVDGRIRFNYSDLVSGTAPGNNGAAATVGIKNAGVQGPDRLLLAFNNGPNAFVGTGLSTLITATASADLYSFTLTGGSPTTLVFESASPLAPVLELLDSGGSVIATGSGGFTNLDRLISNFVVPSTGTYYARVSDVTGSAYSLLVTRFASFDAEGNDTFATAQGLGTSRGALGYAASGNDDYFSFSATAGNTIRVESSTPADGAGEFVNTLNPKIELYNPGGVLVASGVVLGDGRNESISFVAPTTGSYRVRIFSEGGTSGEYFFNATTAAVAPEVLASNFWFETLPQRATFQFDQNVGASLTAADVTVLTLPGGPFVTPASVAFDALTNTATVAFTGTLPNANYRATLTAAGITNGGGTPMAANHVFDFFFLQGDANRSKGVGSPDFNILATNFGTSGKVFSQGNFSYDAAGNVDSADFNLLATNFGSTLPGDGGEDSSRSAGTPGAGNPGGGLTTGTFGSNRIMGSLGGDDEDKLDFDSPGKQA